MTKVHNIIILLRFNFFFYIRIVGLSISPVLMCCISTMNSHRYLNGATKNFQPHLCPPGNNFLITQYKPARE